MQLFPFYTINVIASLSITLGVTLLILKSWILESVASTLIYLSPGAPLVDMWLKPPGFAPTKLYFFNWTNPEEFLTFGTKPKFQELGPYTYLQHTEKKNVVWNDNNTVTFNMVRYWDFDEKATNGNLSDKITTVNVIAVMFGHYARNWNYFTKATLSALYTANSFDTSMTVTAEEFLSRGYEDGLLNLRFVFSSFLEVEMPHFDRFGLLYIRNASAEFEGTYNVGNGLNGNFDLFNWNYNTTTPYFDGACAKVRGSNGELYSRTKTRKDFIEIFIPDLCRTLRLDFEAEVEVDGIKGHKYSLGKRAFDNGTLDPENKCYCDGECIPSGMINTTRCRWGLPVFWSLPHFYDADPVYMDAVEGLNPKKSQREVYIVLEPVTQLFLKAVVRLQSNIFVHPVEGISLLEDVPKVFFPLAWFEQLATLPEPLMSYLKMFLMLPVAITSVSIVLILLGVYILMFVTLKSKLMHLFTIVYKQKLLVSEEVPLQGDVEKNKVQIWKDVKL